jgi:hypothetical protein
VQVTVLSGTQHYVSVHEMISNCISSSSSSSSGGGGGGGSSSVT